MLQMLIRQNLQHSGSCKHSFYTMHYKYV